MKVNSNKHQNETGKMRRATQVTYKFMKDMILFYALTIHYIFILKANSNSNGA